MIKVQPPTPLNIPPTPDFQEPQTGERPRSLTHRLLLIVSAITVFLYSLIVLAPPQRASAWTGSLPVCEVDQALSWAYKDKLEDYDINNKLDNTQTVVMYSFSNNPTDNNTLVVAFADTADFTENLTTHEKTLVMSGNMRRYGIHKEPAHAKYQNDFDVTLGGSVSTGSIACLSLVQGVNYPAGWTGGTYTTVAPQQSQACDGAFDIKCHIGNLLDGVTNTLTDAAAATLNVIGSFFMPSGDDISDAITDFKEFWELKLGFLLYPFEFLADAYNGFTDTSNNWCTTSSCSKYFGTFEGAPFTINFLGLKNFAPDIWDFTIMVIRALYVLGIVYVVRNKYMEITTR